MVPVLTSLSCAMVICESRRKDGLSYGEKQTKTKTSPLWKEMGVILLTFIVPTIGLKEGKRKTSCTMHPRDASMATRPCLISASRRKRRSKVDEKPIAECDIEIVSLSYQAVCIAVWIFS